MIWLLPVAVAAVMALPIGLLMRRVAREAGMLTREVASLAQLREPVLEVQASIRSLRAGVPPVRGRIRPGSSSAP